MLCPDNTGSSRKGRGKTGEGERQAGGPHILEELAMKMLKEETLKQKGGKRRKTRNPLAKYARDLLAKRIKAFRKENRCEAQRGG